MSRIVRIYYNDIYKEILIEYDSGVQFVYLNTPKELYNELVKSTDKESFIKDKLFLKYNYVKKT